MTLAVVDRRSPAAAPPTAGQRGGEWMRDVISLTRRNLVHVAREPAQLSDATIQPILFTVLFVYIFGSAMVIPGGGSYTNFAIGGLVTMNVTTASMGTAVGLSSDLTSGVINRFRTLPMARSAILAGRTLSDLLAAMLCATIVVITGWVIGWRPENGLAGVVAGSCRERFGNPNPAALSNAFPSQHPVFVAVMWSIVIIAVCAPVASRILRKRTTD